MRCSAIILIATAQAGLNPNWSADYSALVSMFPNAKVGFGEIGTSSISAPKSVQTNLITSYYPMVRSGPTKFVGGFFWWNYAEEMYGQGAPAWAADNMQAGEIPR
jgi:hypothetical protein